MSSFGQNKTLPNFIVVDTRQSVLEFTQTICLPIEDLKELILQIFDNLIESNLRAFEPVTPILSMLICKGKPVHWTNAKITKAFNLLCMNIRQTLIDMNFNELISKDNGVFNYTFHDLRDNTIVLIHRNFHKEHKYVLPIRN